MSAQEIRQNLAKLSDVQAALDALKIELTIQLKETQKCTDAAATETTGTWPHFGLLSAS